MDHFRGSMTCLQGKKISTTYAHPPKHGNIDFTHLGILHIHPNYISNLWKFMSNSLLDQITLLQKGEEVR